MSTIAFTVIPPPEALRRDVECIRIAKHTGTDQGLEVKICPNGLPGIVFQLAEDGTSAIESVATRNGSATNVPILFLHGQGADPSIMTFKKGSYITMQAVLKPHALYTIFGMDASVMANEYATPEAFGAETLQKDLVAAHTDAERTTLFYEFLVARLEGRQERDELVEDSLAFIGKNIGSVTVKVLLEQYHISERQFQKRFAKVVGMPPQLYIRVKRVNEALRLMNTGQYERLSDVAHELNFYDQPHFIREMKAFTWVTPKSITQRVSEFHQDIAGSSYL